MGHKPLFPQVMEVTNFICGKYSHDSDLQALISIGVTKLAVQAHVRGSRSGLYAEWDNIYCNFKSGNDLVIADIASKFANFVFDSHCPMPQVPPPPPSKNKKRKKETKQTDSETCAQVLADKGAESMEQILHDSGVEGCKKDTERGKDIKKKGSSEEQKKDSSHYKYTLRSVAMLDHAARCGKIKNIADIFDQGMCYLCYPLR